MLVDIVAKKRAMRRRMRIRRAGLTAAEQADHAAVVARLIADRIVGGETVGMYLARDGELDLAPLIETCWRRSVAVALPVVADACLRFAAYRQSEPLRPNRYGIPEPAVPDWCTPTLVLTPLVAFDDTGQRLGMGGGYYDRYLAARPDLPRVGVAHACQRATEVPATDQDMRLTAVVTEDGWQTCHTG